MDSGEYKVTEITEECNIKTDSETSMDAVEDIASNSMGKSIIAKNQLQVETKKAGRELFSCYNCNHTVNSKDDLISHMKVHCIQRNVHLTTQDDTLNKCNQCNAKFKNKASLDNHVKTTFRKNIERHMSVHSESPSICKLSTCCHCKATFKSKITLDDHVVRKHPDLAASIRRKIYECSECNYKTVIKAYLDKHSSTHSDSGSGFQCIHCKGTFKSKRGLDNHVAKRHPNVISSVDKKVYECTSCVYKTTLKHNFERHMSIHSETPSGYKLSRCIHCNATFKSARALDDHVVTKHPDLPTSMGRKIFQCADCDYKTVVKNYLDKHILLKHTEFGSSYKLRKCTHCNATFKGKGALDDHVVKKHPDFITSVTHKIFECADCAYKTTKKNNFERHLSVHSETGSNEKIITCTHCDATFTRKGALDDHIVKKHPDFITSVTHKIYECSNCVYKTVGKNNFERHMAVHLGTASSSEHMTCVHCNASLKSRKALDDHVIRKHPEFITTISRKIHECPVCFLKTAIKSSFDRHMLTHLENPPSCELSRCPHCDVTFKKKSSLNDHVLKKYPTLFTPSIKTIYDCPKCDFKTTMRKNFDRHASSSVHRDTK
nr:unnamed protein product [Callosobruchus chinensis]